MSARDVTKRNVRTHWFVGEQRVSMSMRRYLEYILGKPGITHVWLTDNGVGGVDGWHEYELQWDYPSQSLAIVAAFDDAHDKLVWMNKKEGGVPYTDVPELYPFRQAHEWPIYVLFREVQ